MAGPLAERLAQLRPDLIAARRAEVDPPLGVVGAGGEIVVAGVDVADPLGGRVGCRGHARDCTVRPPMDKRYVQAGQPEGVPPLELTGERTLPDVPEENYWFRRHLAVYEWIAERVEGERVVDLACGEGYGSDVLARRAAEVVGVDANPEAYEHARLRYVRPNLRFERDLVENVVGAARRRRLPADDRAHRGRRRRCSPRSPRPLRSPTSRRPTG